MSISEDIKYRRKTGNINDDVHCNPGSVCYFFISKSSLAGHYCLYLVAVAYLGKKLQNRNWSIKSLNPVAQIDVTKYFEFCDGCSVPLMHAICFQQNMRSNGKIKINMLVLL
jgi:hypothetical protein